MMKLGEFEIKSGTIRLSDPCYTKDTWCAGTVKAKNGTWIGEVDHSDEGSWGKRVSRIRAYLKGTDLSVVQISDNFDAMKLDIDVGVDSGQAGIFDDAQYPDGERTGEYGDSSTFYGRVCELTIGETPDGTHDPDHPQAGIIDDFGVVSSSGYGDGGYNAYALFDGDEAIAIEIVFIGDEEFEDEDEEWEDWEPEE